MRNISIPFSATAAWFGLATVASAAVLVHIDLGAQMMHVESSSGATYDWPVSTGRPGHDTPTGIFHPQRLYTMVHSIKYNNAPMPHAIFFNGPYAIHGTDAVYALGHVASHGCVRLAPGNAATLFAMVKREGAAISISGAPAGGEPVAATNPHRAGHRLAAARRHRFQERALGYETRRRAWGLTDWALNPLGI